MSRFVLLMQVMFPRFEGRALRGKHDMLRVNKSSCLVHCKGLWMLLSYRNYHSLKMVAFRCSVNDYGYREWKRGMRKESRTTTRPKIRKDKDHQWVFKATKNPAPETGVILKMIEMLTGILHSSFKAYEMRDTHWDFWCLTNSKNDFASRKVLPTYLTHKVLFSNLVI